MINVPCSLPSLRVLIDLPHTYLPPRPSFQVIEMTQVTAASDIWSVGCLIVEVLSGAPPYFELQPMSALFRIVQVGEKGGGGRDGGGVYVKKGCMVMPMAPCMPIPARS